MEELTREQKIEAIVGIIDNLIKNSEFICNGFYHWMITKYNRKLRSYEIKVVFPELHTFLLTVGHDLFILANTKVIKSEDEVKVEVEVEVKDKELYLSDYEFHTNVWFDNKTSYGEDLDNRDKQVAFKIAKLNELKQQLTT